MADTEFIDHGLTDHLGLRLLPLSQPLSFQALDDHLLHWVTHQREPIHMTIGNYLKEVSFHVIHSLQLPLILGNSQLSRHNPHIDWQNGKIPDCYTTCIASCLHAATTPSVSSAPEEKPKDLPDLSSVPPKYLNF